MNVELEIVFHHIDHLLLLLSLLHVMSVYLQYYH
jgi:hypothetical protein